MCRSPPRKAARERGASRYHRTGDGLGGRARHEPALRRHVRSAGVRVDAREVIWVASAGNYIEYALAGRRHLIRGTLSGEEARLAPFGIVRVHRGRLINLGHAVMLEPRPSGDFTVRMDTGEVLSGSRRYRAGDVNCPAGIGVDDRKDKSKAEGKGMSVYRRHASNTTAATHDAAMIDSRTFARRWRSCIVSRRSFRFRCCNRSDMRHHAKGRRSPGALVA